MAVSMMAISAPWAAVPVINTPIKLAAMPLTKMFIEPPDEINDNVYFFYKKTNNLGRILTSRTARAHHPAHQTKAIKSRIF
jgi:hypothetical protein